MRGSGKMESNSYHKIEQLYTLYEQKMYVIAYSILNNSWQAEDAVSDAFVKIIKNLQKIKDVKSDKTKKFIIRIIQNTAIDLYRKNQRESTVFTIVSDEEQSNIADTDNSIEHMLPSMEGREQINKMLSKIPEKYREVLLYRSVHEFSVRETAAVLEISENLGRKRYERARNLLIRELGDD